MRIRTIPVELPPTVEAEYRKIWRLWHGMLLTPIAYLLFAQFCISRRWIDLDPAAPRPWEYPWGRWGVGIASGVMVGGILWMRHLRPLTVQMLAPSPVAALRRWSLDFILMAGLADTLAFLGLVYLAVSGQRWALIAWGAAAYAGHALVYPRRSELAPLPDIPEQP